MDTAIRTRQLTKVFARPQGWRRIVNQRPITAVSDINLSIPQGELFGLLGPNGAGKTTLVKMLCTLILPSSGTAEVAGHALADTGAIRAAVGLVVSDERSFFWRLSARRNLDFFAAMHGLHGRAARARIDAVLEQVGLQEEAEQRFSHFSSGMKQRLAIARSLLHQPRILFLDEPSRSLDPTATRQLHDLLRQLVAGQEITVFLITHDLAEAEALCHRLALMHRGRIRATGHPSELRQQLRPHRYYVVTSAPVAAAVLQPLQAGLPGLQHTSAGSYSRLTFPADEQDGWLTAVIDHLRGHGLAIHAIDSQPATLEEVFAHYTRDQEEA